MGTARPEGWAEGGGKAGNEQKGLAGERERQSGAEALRGSRFGRFLFFGGGKAKLARMVAGLMPLFVTGMLFLSVGRRGAESAPRKAVTARLAAKWPVTPLLLEARWVRWVRGEGSAPEMLSALPEKCFLRGGHQAGWPPGVLSAA